MANVCRACVLFCIDYRLHDQLSAFLDEQGLRRDRADVVRVAGVAKTLTRPDQSSARDFVLTQLSTSRALHGISEVYIINHEDCGAYGLEQVADSQEELRVHREDLQKARSLVERELPGVEVKTYFMWLDGRAEKID